MDIVSSRGVAGMGSWQLRAGLKPGTVIRTMYCPLCTVPGLPRAQQHRFADGIAETLTKDPSPITMAVVALKIQRRDGNRRVAD
jgi:hypothetical protein